MADAGADARLAVVATEPLTRDETWQRGAPGDLWVFGAGHRTAIFTRTPTSPLPANGGPAGPTPAS